MQDLDLNDTEVAFSHLSDKELLRAFLLFKILSFRLFVKFGPPLTRMALKLRLPIQSLIKSTVFAQFVGGETAEECLLLAKDLSKEGVGSILDYAQEGGKGNEEFFANTLEEVSRCINLSSQHRDLIPFCVVKPTGLGSLKDMTLASELDPDEGKAFAGIIFERFERLCQLAAEKRVRLFIDAEESFIQPFVDRTICEMMARHNRDECYIYTTVQMYRKDGIKLLEKAYEMAKHGGYFVGVKLVRGAYMEKERERAKDRNIESPIHETKGETDVAYDQGLLYTAERSDVFHVCVGTHNEGSTLRMVELMKNEGIPNSSRQFEFAQLLGMGNHLTFNLARKGYSVSKYIPYGPLREVIPYMSRRAEENSSTKGQSSRELELISKERKRRRLKTQSI